MKIFSFPKALVFSKSIRLFQKQSSFPKAFPSPKRIPCFLDKDIFGKGCFQKRILWKECIKNVLNYVSRGPLNLVTISVVRTSVGPTWISGWGLLISKIVFSCSQFFQKTNKIFLATRAKVVGCFFERIENEKKRLLKLSGWSNVTGHACLTRPLKRGIRWTATDDLLYMTLVDQASVLKWIRLVYFSGSG